MTALRITLVGLFGCLAVYLFASAPPPLPTSGQTAGGCRHKVTALFDGVNAINQAARGIYTKRIVGGGMAAGLEFGEDWQDPEVEHGPLPALFLRATAAELEAMPPRLGLYLGSDAPINASNLFGPEQATAFEAVKATRAPVYTQEANAGFVAMFPDPASVAPCVTCHNQHPDSPKIDWQLNDIMGATTWTYPAETLSADQFLQTVDALYLAVARTYGRYLSKAETFVRPVAIGNAWPADGNRALPAVEVFLQEVRKQAGPEVLSALLRQQAAVADPATISSPIGTIGAPPCGG